MRTFPLLVYALIICASLIGCRIDATALLSSEDKLFLNIHSATTSVTKEITTDSQTYIELRNWLIKNEDGWSSSPATYVPSVEVRGKRFTLNFLSNIAVLNFQAENGKYHQYVKDITPEEYHFLMR